MIENSTHLSIQALRTHTLVYVVKCIPAFPRLTHLSLIVPGKILPDHYSMIPHILSWPSLAMLLLQIRQLIDGLIGDIWCRVAEIEDKRLLVGPELLLDDEFALLESGGTIWDDTERYMGWRNLVQPLSSRDARHSEASPRGNWSSPNRFDTRDM